MYYIVAHVNFSWLLPVLLYNSKIGSKLKLLAEVTGAQFCSEGKQVSLRATVPDIGCACPSSCVVRGSDSVEISRQIFTAFGKSQAYRKLNILQFHWTLLLNRFFFQENNLVKKLITMMNIVQYFAVPFGHHPCGRHKNIGK